MQDEEENAEENTKLDPELPIQLEQISISCF